jgi:hypothetical protein
MALVIGSVPPGFLEGHPENAALIPLPPQNGGAVGWGTVYLSVGADFFNAKLRVAIWGGEGYWRVSTLDVPKDAGRIGIPISDGDAKVSLARIPTGPDDPGTGPVSWMIETTLKP